MEHECKIIANSLLESEIMSIFAQNLKECAMNNMSLNALIENSVKKHWDLDALSDYRG